MNLRHRYLSHPFGYLLAHQMPFDALHAAAAQGDLVKMREIIDGDDAAPRRLHSIEKTLPICWALQYKQAAAVELLYEYDMIVAEEPLAYNLPIGYIDSDWASENGTLIIQLAVKLRNQVARLERALSSSSPFLYALHVQCSLFIARYSYNSFEFSTIINKVKTSFKKLSNVCSSSHKNRLYFIAAAIQIAGFKKALESLPYHDQQLVAQIIQDILTKLPKDFTESSKQDLSLAFYHAANCAQDKFLFECALSLSSDFYFKAVISLHILNFRLDRYRQCTHYIDNIAADYTVYVERIPFYSRLLASTCDTFAVKCLTDFKKDYQLQDINRIYAKAYFYKPVLSASVSLNSKVELLICLEKIIRRNLPQAYSALQKVKDISPLFDYSAKTHSNTIIMLGLLKEIIIYTLQVLNMAAEDVHSQTNDNILSAIQIFFLSATILRHHLDDDFHHFMELYFIKLTSYTNNIFPPHQAAKTRRLILTYDPKFSLDDKSELAALGIYAQRPPDEVKEGEVTSRKRFKIIAPT